MDSASSDRTKLGRGALRASNVVQPDLIDAGSGCANDGDDAMDIASAKFDDDYALRDELSIKTISGNINVNVTNAEPTNWIPGVSRKRRLESVGILRDILLDRLPACSTGAS